MPHRYCLLVLLLVLPSAQVALAGLTAENLRCEQLRNPTGVDAAPPRLSWTLASDDHGQFQSAYQVRVASSRQKLVAGEADLWDTGRVASGECVLIPYAGRPLHSHQACYWQVRVWGRDGQPSPWSETQHWLMGLLHQSDWTGRWIGLPVAERVENLQDTHWIWHEEGADPSKQAPGGERLFRRAFEVDGAKEVERAVFRITGDDRVAIYLNGRNLGSRSGPNSTKELSVTARLLAGRNVIAVRAKNDEAGTPAGVIAWLEIVYADGSRQLVASDAEWLSAADEAVGWREPDFDDSSWLPVKVLGPVGIQPWGPVRHAEDRTLPARHLRKEFAIEGPIKRAVVSYSGLGASVLRINGQRIGDAVLSPAMTQYDKRVPYVTHDVTAALREGENAVGVVLANGRYYAPRSEVYAAMVQYGPPKLNFCLWIERPDGSVTAVVSDASWRLTDEGPVRANNEYDGEHYDARRDLAGWDQPGYDDSDWRAAEVLPDDPAELSSAGIAPMRVTQTIQPVALNEVKPGVWVYDLGQNMVGWCRLKVQGPAGAKVRLRHAEVLRPDGMIDVANLRTAEAIDTYTLRGGEPEMWEPEFTLHGFRYVEVTGWPGEPTLASLEGRVVHDDLEQVGAFDCSDELLNQIYRNAVWGFRGNYRSVPTDCPQRDERQGWLGDRFEIARGESYVFGVGPLYAKWLRDIRDAQRPSGSLPDVAPTHWPTYSDNVVWPNATIILPEMLRQQYADRRPTREQFACNRRWADFMSGFIEDGLISRDSYGDWCVPPEDPHLIHSEDPARITDKTLLASSFFAYDLRLLSEQARLLGKPKEASRLAAQSRDLVRAINAKYLEGGRYANNTQTSSVIPLALGVTPPARRRAVFNSLVARIEENDRHIATGLVGGQHLLRTLTDGGRPDLALAIATQRDYPSWGYMVEQDATTIWELWNGVTADPAMNSHNHVMLVGDLVTWLYEDLAGIAPDPAAEGFRQIDMAPQFVDGLDRVSASHRSPYGLIESAWRKTGDQVQWRVRIPPGTTATLSIPAARSVTVDRGGLEEVDDPAAKAAGHARYRIGSGVHRLLFTIGQ